MRDTTLIKNTYTVAAYGMITAVSLIAVSAVLFWYTWPKRVFGAIIIFVVLADLWYFGARYIITSPLSSCYWPPALAAYVKPSSPDYRTVAPNIAIPGANQNMNDRICSIDGYQTINIGFFKRYVDYSQGVLPAKAGVSLAIENITPMIEALGLKYLLLPRFMPFARNGYVQAFDVGETVVYERLSPTPRTYIVHESTVAEGTDALEKTGAVALRPASNVVLDNPPTVFCGAPMHPAQRDNAVIVSEAPNELTVVAELAAPGFLVLTDTFYPGWRVTVDGKAGELLRANYAFRAVPLKGGRHEVTFSYRPRSFRYGAVVSLLSLLILIPILIYTGTKRKT
jgi:hypothetical protein